MIYRAIALKHILKLVIAMAAVLAGLTNLSIIPLLSQRQEQRKRQEIKETVRLDLSMIIEREKEYPPREPPPVFTPELPTSISKPDINNVKRVMQNQAIELPDIKSLRQDIKAITLPPLVSIKTDRNCPWGHLKNRRSSMNHIKQCFDVDEVDVIPRAISTVQPFYPYRAKRLSTGGYVTISFLVDINGEVSKLIIVESNPHGIFDQSVRDTVTKWKFTPGRKDGKPVRTWLRKTIEFTLDGNT